MATSSRFTRGVCCRSIALIALTWIWSLPGIVGQADYDDKRGPNTPLRLNVLEGEPTSLPCPINTATREPISAVWFHVSTHAYKEYGSSPYYTNGHLQAKRVYAIEAPEPSATALGGTGGLVDGTHWKRPSWSGRAFFSLLSDPPALRLNRLERSDSGNYVCNVTYHDNVTSAAVVVTESRVELFVAAQACPPLIKDSRGATIKSTAGPYAEGEAVRLTCEIETCDHDVTLTWYQNGTQMRTAHGTVATSDGGWKNLVTVGPLSRRDLHSNITCLAASNVSLPGSATVLLDLYMAPTAVIIWSWPAQQTDAPSRWIGLPGTAAQREPPNKTAAADTAIGSSIPLSADTKVAKSDVAAPASFGSPSERFSAKPRSFECEATGSRPAANVTWFMDGTAVDPAFSRSVTEGNVTTSMLLLPASAQSGRLLECRAINGNLPESRGVLSRFLKVDMSRVRASSLECVVGNYTDTSFSVTCASRRRSHARSGSDDHAVAKSRLRIELFDATAGNRSVRGFWVATQSGSATGAGGDPQFLTGLKPATDYLVVARLEPEMNVFATYVRTMAPAQTVREREERASTAESTTRVPPMMTTIAVIVCIVATATLGLAATSTVLWFKHHRRRSRLLRAAAARKHAEHKAYLAADASCS